MKKKIMRKINTLNESSLHKTLKLLYAVQNNGRTEIQVNRWICDIVTEKGEIIEIQNKNLRNIKEKVQELLKCGKKVKIVHPVISEKIIITFSEDGQILRQRKSPVKENLYTMLKELTSYTEFLLDENFTLEIPEIKIEEYRRQTAEPVQLMNKSRRFKKNFIKTDKKLLSIGASRIFKTKDDYLKLLPETDEKDFSSKDISLKFREDKTYPSNAGKYTNLLLWLLFHMNLLEKKGKKGKLIIYGRKLI